MSKAAKEAIIFVVAFMLFIMLLAKVTNAYFAWEEEKLMPHVQRSDNASPAVWF